MSDRALPAADFETVIRPSTGWRAVDLRELWRYRELLAFFALRDLKVRYKQSVLGAAWAVIPPLVNTLVFGLLFSLLGDQPTTEGIPYVLNTYSAMIAWQLFATTTAASGNSLVANANLIKKIYFPRLITPLAPTLVSTIDFLVNSAVLGLMILGFHLLTPFDFEPSLRLLALPLFAMLALASTLAISLWLAALNALYRDVRFVIPFIVQLGMYATPVLYDLGSILDPERLGSMLPWVKTFYALNPMTSVVQGVRWALFGQIDFPAEYLMFSVPMITVLLIGGLFYFRRMERLIIDLV